MFANLVKKVMFTCPVCNTSITFDVPTDHGEMVELYSAINELVCPKCKKSLSYFTHDMVNAIHEYNSAAFKLSHVQKSCDAKLG